MTAFKIILSLLLVALATLVSANDSFSLRGLRSVDERELSFFKPKAKVCNKSWWKGDCLSLDTGLFDWSYLQPKHFDDRIESIYLPFFYKAKMCSDPGLQGHCKTFKFSYGIVKVGDGVSSIKISKWW